MCCDGWEAEPERTIGECPICGGDVDDEEYTTEAGCNYSPRCEKCGSAPCDDSC